MPELFTDGAITEDPGTLVDYSSSAAENFGAGFQRQWDTNPVAFVGRGVRTFAEDWNARFGVGDLVGADTAREENKRLGLDLKVPDGGISRYELDALQYLKQREIAQLTVSARPHDVTATLAGFAGGFSAGALDPLNVASAFIPVVQEARAEAWLAAAGESFFARAAARAKIGAIEGVVGAAAIEPIVYTGAQQEQLQYGIADSFVNVMFGGILGGGLHILGGAAYDWRMRRALTQLDVGLRSAYAGVPERTQLATLHQAVDALDTSTEVRSDEVLATGVRPEQRAALDSLAPAARAEAPATREIAEAPGLAFDAKPIKESVAITPAGRRVPVLYAIVDADNLITSHTKDLGENPAYPQELQPRDRSRAQSEAQISNMAAKLNPELLGEQPNAGDGAPIVDKAGIVESGNGRVIALQRIAEGNPEKWREYQDFLTSQGYDTAGIAKPVLVRVRTGELAASERVAFTREANAPTVSGLSASEQARADAKAMPDDILDLHQGGDFRNVGNGRFVSAAISALAPSQGERAGFFRPDGSLSDEGARRLERALLARAFGDDAALITALTEASEESGIKAIGKALVDVSPLWSRMRADAAADRIDPAVDSTKNLLAAVRTIREARAAGKNLLDMVNQVDLLSGDIDPKTVTWVRAMFRNANLTGPLGREKVAELLEFYAIEARKQSAAPNLLGDASATPEQILNAKREQDRRRGKQLELLGGQPREREPDGVTPAETPAAIPEPRAREAGATVGPDRIRDVEAGDRLTVYHASPYRFEKPSLEHAGAGEGAQVYGHGLYATETPGDAAPFGMSRSDTLAGHTPVEKWPAPAEMAQHLVTYNNGLRHAIHDIEDKIAEAATPEEARLLQTYLDYLNAHPNLEVQRGHIYEWTVDARMSDLIDLDETLAKQSDEVLGRLRTLLPDLFEENGTPKKNIKGPAIYKAMVKKEGSAKAASKALRETGVKGVVHSPDYRMDPEGRELVIFSDDDIVGSRRTDEPQSAIERGPPLARDAVQEGDAATSAYVETLDLPKRKRDESDAAFIERALPRGNDRGIPTAADVPAHPGIYFDLSRPGTIISPVSNIDIVKEGRRTEHTKQLFALARAGVIDRRAPITVRAEPDGRYTVIDGSGTALAARELGWSELPVNIIEGTKPIFGDVEPGSILYDTRAHAEQVRVREGKPYDERGAGRDIVRAEYHAPEAAFKAVGERFKESQRGWSVDQAFKAAERNQSDLDDLAEDIVSDLGDGVEYTRAPFQKKRARVEEKIREKGAPDAGAITDIVRGGFKTKTPEDADALIAALAKRATILDEGWRRYPGNYIDRKVNVRFEDGQIGEIIIASPHMWDVKNDAHLLMERSRGMTDGERDRQRLVDVEEMNGKYFAPAIRRDDGPWERAYSRLASDVGSGGVLPKVFEKSSSVTSAPERPTASNVGASMTSQPEAPSLRTNALSASPSRTNAAGVPSQLSQVTDIEGTPSRSMAAGAREINDRWAHEDAEISAKAAQEINAREATIEDVAADAALFDAHLTSLRERGLLTGEDEADLLAAEQTAVDLEHRAAAYEAAGACEMEG